MVLSRGFQSITNTTRKRRVVFSLLGLILWCIIIIPIVINQKNKGEGETINYTSDGYTLDQNDEKNGMKLLQGVKLKINFQSVDASAKSLSLVTIPFLMGDEYVNEVGESKKNITCDLSFGEANIKVGKVPVPVTYTMPIAVGNVKDYPFENFLAISTIVCLNGENKVPFAIVTEKDLQTYEPVLEAKNINNLTEGEKDVFTGLYTDNDAIAVVILLRQPVSTKLFSIFIILVMWGLTLSLAIITFDIIKDRREVPPPLLAIGVSMLFALPPLRGTQPNVPFMGCLSDIAGFYWCIALVGLCSMLNIFAFALRWRKPVTDIIN